MPSGVYGHQEVAAESKHLSKAAGEDAEEARDKDATDSGPTVLPEGEDVDEAQGEEKPESKRKKDKRGKKRNRDLVFPPTVFEEFNQSISAIFKGEYGGGGGGAGGISYGGSDQVERVTAKATAVYLHTVAKRLGAITPLLGSVLT